MTFTKCKWNTVIQYTVEKQQLPKEKIKFKVPQGQGDQTQRRFKITRQTNYDYSILKYSSQFTEI